MGTVNFRDVDLNLLVVLDVLLKERSVSGAATLLNLTPSAVSHALARLRKLFDDELLIRDGRRMTTTTRGQELGESLPRVLRHLEGVFVKPSTFDPSTSSRTFRLMAPDFVAPRILSGISKLAPHVRVELVSKTPHRRRELAEGHYDALVSFGGGKDEGLRSIELGESTWRVYGRANHPAFQSWSTEAWSRYPHLQIGTSVQQGTGPVERTIGELGVTRRVGAIVPYFSMAAPVLAETDLLFTIPPICIELMRKRYNLDHREVPFPMPVVSLTLSRSAKHGDEPGVRWFLKRVETACRNLFKAY